MYWPHAKEGRYSSKAVKKENNLVKMTDRLQNYYGIVVRSIVGDVAQKRRCPKADYLERDNF